MAIERTVSRTHASTAVDLGALQHPQSIVEEQQAGGGRVVANVRTQVGIATRDHPVRTWRVGRVSARSPPPPPPLTPPPAHAH